MKFGFLQLQIDSDLYNVVFSGHNKMKRLTAVKEFYENKLVEFVIQKSMHEHASVILWPNYHDFD